MDAPLSVRRCRACAWLAAALLALPVSSRASQIGLAPISGVSPVGSTTPVLVPQFDPALGMLTGVSLDFTLVLQGGVAQWDNESPTPVSGTFQHRAAFDVVTPDGSNVAFPGDLFMATLPADDDVAADFVGADSLTHSHSAQPMDHLVEPVDLAPFVGLGSIELSLLINGVVSTPPLLPDEAMEIQVVESGEIDWELAVTYTYVPEPGTGLLCMSGLLLLAVRRRTRLHARPAPRAYEQHHAVDALFEQRARTRDRSGGAHEASASSVRCAGSNTNPS